MQKVILVYIINFLLAVSTTIGMTIVPLLATDGLGISLLVLGFIEGGSELLSSLIRLISGNLFDRMKNRRFLFILPTALAFISKIILFVPSTLAMIMTKVIERISNGAFATPRDAFIGAYFNNKGTALGVLSTTKTFGCVIGPILVSLSTIMFGPVMMNIPKLILLASAVCFICVICSIMISTDEIKKTEDSTEFNYQGFKVFFKAISPILILSFLYFLGRFNDGSILLYLKKQGFPEWYFLTTISFFNTIMLIVSPILGYYIDQKREYYVLLITIVALISFNILFLYIDTMPWTFASLGLVMWGIQRAGAQITFTSIILKKIPVMYYGTAIGIYSVLSGLGVFIASFVGGYLAQKNFSYIFMLSGFFSSSSLLLTLYFRYKRKFL